MRSGPHPLALHLAHGWTAACAGQDFGLVSNFLRGVARYQASDFVRLPTSCPVIATQGLSRVLDYGPVDGVPVLVLPSLINPATVLDLLPGHSLLEAMCASGVRPLLIDWGEPDALTRQYDLDDFVQRQALPLLLATTARLTAPVGLLGYCLGGTLSMALATLAADHITRLALLATPWDWNGYAAAHRTAIGELIDTAGPALNSLGVLPADSLQAIFAGLDPELVVRKFAAFAATPEPSAAADLFVALEDWSNSGPALAAPIAQQLFGDWMRHGRTGWPGIDPATVRQPCLLVTAARDRIVPPASALPLARLLPNATHLALDAGHVGMVVGSQAPQRTWAPLSRWFHDQSSGTNAGLPITETRL